MYLAWYLICCVNHPVTYQKSDLQHTSENLYHAQYPENHLLHLWALSAIRMLASFNTKTADVWFTACTEAVRQNPLLVLVHCRIRTAKCTAIHATTTTGCSSQIQYFNIIKLASVAQWCSGRVLDLRSIGRRFESQHCPVQPWASC